MNETIVTVIGRVANDPQLRATSGGIKVASFRVASTERIFDRGLGSWRDGATTFWQVAAWRAAAENVVDSLVKGQPVVVSGKVRESSFEGKDGVRRTSLEIDASVVGHDLTRGVAIFTKASPAARPETHLVQGSGDDATDLTTDSLDGRDGLGIDRDDLSFTSSGGASSAA